MSTELGAVQTDEGLSSFASLPLLQTTNVRVEAVGSDFLLFLNNTLETQVTIKGIRRFGTAFLYASNPWSIPAMAKIASIQMTPISAITTVGANLRRLSQFATINEQLIIARDYSGMNTFVPVNYSLSFDITPTGTANWGNIIHYSGTGSDGGLRSRMPGIFVSRATNRL